MHPEAVPISFFFFQVYKDPAVSLLKACHLNNSVDAP